MAYAALQVARLHWKNTVLMGNVLISQRYSYLNSVIMKRQKSQLNNLVVRISGTVDWDKLTGAFQRVIEAHDALRTIFYLEGRNVCDRVVPDVSCSFQHVDAGNASIEEFLQTHCEDFNLKTAPLIRFYHVKVNHESYLVLQLPHINTDGWSLQKIMEHIGCYYAGRETAKITSFGKYKEAFGNYMASRLFAKDQKYWTTAARALINESYENEPAKYKPHTCSVAVPGHLNTYCALNGYTLFQVMLFTALLLLGMLRRRTTNAIMFSVHNRAFETFLPGENFNDTVGLIVNRLFLSVELDVNVNVATFLQQCSEQLMLVMKHHKYPFEYIVEGLSPQERKMLTPAYFNFFQYASSFPLSAGAALVRETIYKEEERLPFCIDVAGIGDSLRTVVASNGTYPPATVEQIAADYHYLLSVICSREDLAIDQLFVQMGVIPTN